MNYSNLRKLVKSPVLSGMLHLFIALYAGVLAPQLPDKIKELVDNPFVKMALIVIIMYVATKNISYSIGLSVAFIVTLLIIESNKASTTLAGAVQTSIDTTQKFGNKLIDGAQDLATNTAGLVPEPAGSLVSGGVGIVNNLVDTAQDVTNMGIDTSQKILDTVIGDGGLLQQIREKGVEMVEAYD